MADTSLIGTNLVLTLDGQKVTGRVVEAHDDRLVVRVGIKQPARGYQGVIARAILPNGEVVKFDLGQQSHYSEVTIEVPLPEASDASSAPPDQERRKFFRLDVELDIAVVENIGFDKEYVRTRGTTVNLSGGGFLAEFEQAMVPGVYKFRIQLPTESLTVAGRVFRKPNTSARVTPVQFVDMSEVERSKLIRVIFNRMRTLKNPEQAENAHHDAAPAKSGDEPRYLKRREKFAKPGKIRYW